MTTQYRPPQSGRDSDCPPKPDSPAGQPHAPGDCDPIPPPGDHPYPPDPKPCPPPDCEYCPPGPGTDQNCLEKLIDAQAAALVAADKAKAFKADLEAFLGKAKTASQEYNRDKYDKLLKQWGEQDIQIAELIRRLVCAVPCWKCVIECDVCPLLNSMHDAEQQLRGDGGIPSDLHNLWDLQYWYTRDKDAKERRFNRIKAVLAAWEKPAQTIEKALADDAKLIADAGTGLGNGAAKVVYDVFFRLVPMHLAIAPPAGVQTTYIDKKYTEFCACDGPLTPDDCCGPDVGEQTLRQRLIGPQPYLIDPRDYFKVICCLVDKRYRPAQEQLAAAEANLSSIDSEIKRYKAKVENGLKTFDKDAKGAIPADVDCCKDFKKPDSDSNASAR